MPSRHRPLEPLPPRPPAAASAVALLAALALAGCTRSSTPSPATADAAPTRNALTPAAYDSTLPVPNWVLRSAPEAMPDKVRDAAIAASVSSALAREASLHGFSIDVDSAGGRVVLQGLAPDLDARARAGSIAARVDGVQAVENHLRIAPR